MSRTRTYIPLDVFLNGRLVGRLIKEPGGSVNLLTTKHGSAGRMPYRSHCPFPCGKTSIQDEL